MLSVRRLRRLEVEGERHELADRCRGVGAHEMRSHRSTERMDRRGGAVNEYRHVARGGHGPGDDRHLQPLRVRKRRGITEEEDLQVVRRPVVVVEQADFVRHDERILGDHDQVRPGPRLLGVACGTPQVMAPFAHQRETATTRQRDHPRAVVILADRKDDREERPGSRLRRERVVCGMPRPAVGGETEPAWSRLSGFAEPEVDSRRPDAHGPDCRDTRRAVVIHRLHRKAQSVVRRFECMEAGNAGEPCESNVGVDGRGCMG